MCVRPRGERRRKRVKYMENENEGICVVCEEFEHDLCDGLCRNCKEIQADDEALARNTVDIADEKFELSFNIFRYEIGEYL